MNHWRRFRHSDELAGHLIAAASIDTSTERARQLLADLGPAIMQKLALAGGRELDYRTFSLLELPRNDRPGVEVGVSLDARSRGTVATSKL